MNTSKLANLIAGDLVRETNIFPNQIERAKEIIDARLNESGLLRALKFAVAQLNDMAPKGNKYRGLVYPAIREGQDAIARCEASNLSNPESTTAKP